MAERLFEEVGINKREAKELVEFFFEEIRNALHNGEQVKLSGFGNFDLRCKNERPGRNPKTGEEIPITARRVVTFRPGQKLKARVDAYKGAEARAMAPAPSVNGNHKDSVAADALEEATEQLSATPTFDDAKPVASNRPQGQGLQSGIEQV